MFAHTDTVKQQNELEYWLVFHAPAWFNVLVFKSCILHLYCDMTAEGRILEPEETIAR
jgi:hypothetical protein